MFKYNFKLGLNPLAIKYNIIMLQELLQTLVELSSLSEEYITAF